jgi:hypothetical protein
LISLGVGDLLARQLPGQHRVKTFNSLRRVAIGDRLHFEHVKFAEIGDLVERQSGVLDEPDGGRLRHQRNRHGKSPLRFARPPGEACLSSWMTGMAGI